MLRSAAFALSLLAAAPAVALDLTGTWHGRFTCSAFDDEGAFRIPEPDQVFRISQTGNDVRVAWGDPDVPMPTFIPLTGLAIPDAGKPDAKGEVVLADCESSADLVNAYSELHRYRVRVNREKGKGSFKGVTLYAEPASTVGSCKASFKLVDPADPGVGGCP